MSDIARIVGERLKTYRNRAKLSQEELAEKSGLHHTYIGQLERGEKNATLESVEKVARALSLSFEVLFENIISGNVDNEIPQKCYGIITALTKKEQQAIYELIVKTIDYKRL